MHRSRLGVLSLVLVLLMSMSGCFGDEDPTAKITVEILVLESGILDNDNPEPLQDVEVSIDIGRQLKDWKSYHKSIKRTDDDGRIRFSIKVGDIGYYQALCRCLGNYETDGVNVEYIGGTYTLSVVFD
jgi:hypothetical protein